ncbi:MAG: hypothetical protein ACREL9_03675 [Gemmatimonadales bacterium]
MGSFRAPARLAASLVAAGALTTCLPSEPSGPERIGFKFAASYRVPVAGVVTPLIRITADGQVLKNPRYRLESLNPEVVLVTTVPADSAAPPSDTWAFRSLVGVARGTATVRVVYEAATGAPDSVFSVQVVVSRIRIGGSPWDTTANSTLKRLGDTVRLSAIAFDENGGLVPGLLPFTWSSSDTTVATIAPRAGGIGLVTARNEGTTLITAQLDDREAYLGVTVTQAAARVVVIPELDTLRTLTRSRGYSFSARDSTGVPMQEAKAQWSSTNPAVAQVDSLGVATARHAGTTLIIARVGPAADTATLVVKQVLRYVRVAPHPDTLTALGDTVRVAALASDSLDNPIPDPPPISWATGDTTIATVDPAGLVTARRNGFVIIIASSAGQSGTSVMLVRQVVVRVQITEDSVALTGAGAMAQLSAVGEDRNGYTVDTARVDWRTPLPFVATVDSTGRVTARGDGMTRVTATVRFSQQADTAIVSVTGAPQDLIAFESPQGIEAIRPDGTLRTVLIWNYLGNCSYYYYYGQDEYATDAAWSPDGNQLAYTRSLYNCYYGSWDYEIYKARVDGSTPQNLTNHYAADSRPAWSPDGGKIAFSSDREGGRKIFVMNADGSTAVRLMPPDAENPAWSPDGSKLAFESLDDIYVVSTDGIGAVNLTNHAQDDAQAAWSPNGSQLAFVSNRDGAYDVWLMNPDGSGALNLTGSLLTGATNEFYPAWSPDGSRIAFTTGQDLYVVNRDGTGMQLIATNGGRPAWRPVTPLVVPAGPASVARARPQP